MHTILIVEDNLDARNALSELLQLNGFLILQARSGAEAFEILESHQPDVVLADIDMPHIDGLTMCFQIRQNPLTSEIPLILISGRLPIYQPEFVFDLVQKPVLVQELLTSLKSALRNSPLLKRQLIPD
jgi:CheY-like chemotaxis protein